MFLPAIILATTAFSAAPDERLQLNCEVAEVSEAPAMAETESERTARLYNDFEYALLMFDRCLEVATDNVQSSASGGGGGGAAGGEAANEDSSESSESEAENESQSGESAAQPNTPRGALQPDEGGPVFTTPPPEDLGDGNDDDVVARQLREAAMAEPDPVVREKLWDEYRKYKGIKK